MRRYLSLLVVLISLFTIVSVSCLGQEAVVPQDGDIVFHESTSRQSPIIKLAQHSRWKEGVYRVKRLKRPLSASTIEKMKTVGAKYKGKHYDTLFQWNDNKMYCSELIWKIYSQGADIDLCTPEQFSDFPISAPAVKTLIKKRYGDKFNPSEQIVSPYALFKSRLLKEVRYSGF